MLSRLIPGLFVVLWATGFIGARYAMPHAEPFTFLGVRFAITALLLAPFVLIVVRRSGIGRRQAVHATIAGGLMHGLYLGGVFWAIARGMPSGLSALIVGLQPLITAVLARPALGDRISSRQWIGLGVGFVGVVTVLAPKLGELSSGVTAATLAACVVAVLAMSAGTIWQKKFVGDADLVAGTFCQYLGGTALMVAASAIFETQRFDWTGELFFALAWLVLVLSLGAIFLLMVLIRQGQIARVASLFYLVPPVTAVIAFALFAETLTPLQIAGMAIACLGVGLATRKANPALSPSPRDSA